MAAAKQEGRVVIATGMNIVSRTPIVEGFKKACRISVETIAGRGSQLSVKVIGERRAGLHNYDISLIGSTSAINNLKPAGDFDPLETAFILSARVGNLAGAVLWWVRLNPSGL